MDSFSFSPSHNKAPPRKGRRASNNPAAVSNSNMEDDFTASEELETTAPALPSRTSTISSPPKTPADVPPKSRKTGGWADETSSTKSGKSRRESTNLIEQERFQQSPDSTMKPESEDDDIPLIPDLDELQDEEMLSQVARAPSVIGNKVASFMELDSNLMKQSVISTLDDINLSVISCRLYPEVDVKEADNTWTWDLLFTEVASDLRTEWEANAATDIKIS